MYLMLDEEVNHGNNGGEEGSGDVFPVFDRFGVGWAQGETAGSPRDCG